ncbi:MAG: alpha/beta fold hydrolase [Acidimicrobiales bacterium]
MATVDGVRLHYLDRGTGDPVLVLLHAFPLHAGMWAPQLEALSARVRVIAPDLVGFGGSDVPDDPDAYSVEAWADSVAGLANHLGLDRIVLAGLSMGGYVAFSFLRRHRARLAGLVLADTRPGPDTNEAAERRSAQQRQVAEEGTAGLIDTLVQGLLSEHTRLRRPELVDAARHLMDSPPAGYVGALEAMKRRPDSTPELTGIDVPTMVVVGEEDALSPPDVARDMLAVIPGAELSVLAGAGHLSNLEAVDAFNATVMGLLGRCQEPPHPR